ncbi:hypothetical protein [Spirosoma pollinicola]|uniref:Aerotolerance regulator N-terminal domain-containing protein n=1 Tax=Spirosoma pollinicola TaxID=2057025 RepID=A0A2K8YVJ9_9BACT|nr:hypothetical protein [Spirosoma pollinicola]AUD01604.1 hypothetical protein CWM47_07100 [Spirosoma pollinicola]
MQTSINWTDPINWFIALALLILLAGQLWLISRNQSLASGRKWIRAGLNLLLWLVIVSYFLQPHWQRQSPSSHALLIGDDVPTSFARHLKDSLHIQDSFSSRNFRAEYDSITLAGQRFPTETLTQLSNAALQWIPYNQLNQLTDIHWKGIVRQGEMQRVAGRILSSEKQLLRLRFGKQTLDSVALHEGDNAFFLRFPAFSRGRSQSELVLGSTTTLDTIRFFTRTTEPLTVQFLLNSPDFESKTLADWLGKQGHTVQVVTTLSTNIRSNVNINKVGKTVGKTTPDLIITEPGNAANATVRKAVADGKAVLFINLTNPETDCQTINKVLGSKWQVRKTASEPVVPIGNGLSSLPYRFTDNLNQFAVTGYPIAVQRTSGRVGVSLLSETYPVSLSGDSLTYNRVWSAVLARLSPSDKNVIQVDEPIYSGLQQAITINNTSNASSRLSVGKDTVSLVKSPINDRLTTGQSLFRQTGWQTVQDTLAVYVNARNQNDPIAERQLVNRFMIAHAEHNPVREGIARTTTVQVPNWVWLFLLVSCFTALWIEPKLI